MEQKGYISDGTSELEFVDWGNAPDFEIGDVYKFDSVVTNEYKGKISISLTSSTKFKKIEDDDIFDEKSREQIIREIENKGPANAF